MSEPIYDSLLQAALTAPGFTGKRTDETDQEYFHRLAEAISMIDEDRWLELPEDAKQWYDSALGDDNDLKPELAVPDGYVVKVEAPPAPAPTRRRVATAPKQSVYDTVLGLVAAQQFAPKSEDETDQQYLARLLQDLPSEIPASINEWVASADVAEEQGKPIPLPEGYVTTDKPQPAKVDPPGNSHSGNGTSQYVDENGQPLTGIKLFNAKLANGEVTRRKRTPNPQKAVAKQPTGRTAREDSTTAIIRTAVTRNPLISVEALQQMLKEQGRDTALTTITTTRASHLAALRAIQRCGWTPPAGADALEAEAD